MNKAKGTLTGLAMDIFFIIANLLLMFNIVQIPRIPNAILVIVIYLACLYLYRYVFKYGIGNGAKPLFVQVGINLPSFLQSIVNYIFGFIILFFPGYLLVMCIAAATPEFSFDHWHPMVKLGMGIVFLLLMIVNALVFFQNSGPEKPGTKTGASVLLPPPSQSFRHFLPNVLLPILALLAGYTIANLANAFYHLSPDPGLQLTLALTSFIPLRYLVMRTAGVSRTSLISFLITIVMTCAGYISELYRMGH